jgi:hypothetical protein
VTATLECVPILVDSATDIKSAHQMLWNSLID